MTAFQARQIEGDRWQNANAPVLTGFSSQRAGDGRPLLARTIEREVLPRLLLARLGATPGTPCESADITRLVPAGPSELAGLVMGPEAAEAFAYVEVLRDRGVDPETLYIDVLAPVARHLGEMWEQDLCSFTEVTIGLTRLQQVLRRVSAGFQNNMARPDSGCRALLVPAPGEQHTFGLLMVCEFFRRAGWEVSGGAQSRDLDLTTMAHANWFSMIGFSVATENHLDELAIAIRRIRRASRNPAIGVMVGGPVFIEHPELVAGVGADATAMDGRQAVLQAHRLMALLPARL